MRPFLALCFACFVLLTSRNVSASDFTDWADQVVSGVFFSENKEEIAIFVNSKWENRNVEVKWKMALGRYIACTRLKQFPKDEKDEVTYFIILHDLDRYRSINLVETLRKNKYHSLLGTDTLEDFSDSDANQRGSLRQTLDAYGWLLKRVCLDLEQEWNKF